MKLSAPKKGYRTKGEMWKKVKCEKEMWMVVDHDLLNAEYQIEHGGFCQFLIGQGVDGERFKHWYDFWIFWKPKCKKWGYTIHDGFWGELWYWASGKPMIKWRAIFQINGESNGWLNWAVGRPPHSLQLIQRLPHFVVLVGDPHFRVLEHRVPDREREQRSHNTEMLKQRLTDKLLFFF